MKIDLQIISILRIKNIECWEIQIPWLQDDGKNINYVVDDVKFFTFHINYVAGNVHITVKCRVYTKSKTKKTDAPLKNYLMSSMSKAKYTVGSVCFMWRLPWLQTVLFLYSDSFFSRRREWSSTYVATSVDYYQGETESILNIFNIILFCEWILIPSFTDELFTTTSF